MEVSVYLGRVTSRNLAKLLLLLLVATLLVQSADAFKKKRKRGQAAYWSGGDLHPAGSYHGHAHHGHHGHHAHGWLTMGAYSGPKGAFGWHSKHPVGAKKKMNKYGR